MLGCLAHHCKASLFYRGMPVLMWRKLLRLSFKTYKVMHLKIPERPYRNLNIWQPNHTKKIQKPYQQRQQWQPNTKKKHTHQTKLKQNHEKRKRTNKIVSIIFKTQLASTNKKISISKAKTTSKNKKHKHLQI